jgi:hypothetical protein
MPKSSYLEPEPAVRRQTDAGSPGCQLLATGKVGQEGTSEARPIENTSRGLETTAPPAVKSRRPRVIRPDLEPVDQVCVSILDFTKHRGRRVSFSGLRRGVNAYRYGNNYELAIQKLQELGAITVEKERRTRRQWITVLEIPKRSQATRPKPKTRRHKPRSRGQTLWFRNLMMCRAAAKLGKQIGILLRENLANARREQIRRNTHRLLATILAK